MICERKPECLEVPTNQDQVRCQRVVLKSVSQKAFLKKRFSKTPGMDTQEKAAEGHEACPAGHSVGAACTVSSACGGSELLFVRRLGRVKRVGVDRTAARHVKNE